MNFNKNYNNHIFFNTDRTYHYFKCAKCYIYMRYLSMSKNNKYDFSFFNDSSYKELTCDEIIIKKLLE